jgi:hypothetical protein
VPNFLHKGRGPKKAGHRRIWKDRDWFGRRKAANEQSTNITSISVSSTDSAADTPTAQRKSALLL